MNKYLYPVAYVSYRAMGARVFLEYVAQEHKEKCKMSTIVSMTDLKQNTPFDGVESEYKSITDILGREIKIIDYKTFENDKGEGAFILCKDIETEEVFHLCTHSVGLVGTLKNPKVRETLDYGDVIATKIVQRMSSKSNRLVYAFM